jgi:hypothetical protein
MESKYLEEARHVANHTVFLRFNDGVRGEVDLRDVVERYEIAAPLNDPVEFSKFFLDPWPTICWSCGFDISPETLYEKCRQNAEQAVAAGNAAVLQTEDIINQRKPSADPAAISALLAEVPDIEPENEWDKK